MQFAESQELKVHLGPQRKEASQRSLWTKNGWRKDFEVQCGDGSKIKLSRSRLSSSIAPTLADCHTHTHTHTHTHIHFFLFSNLLIFPLPSFLLRQSSSTLKACLPLCPVSVSGADFQTYNELVPEFEITSEGPYEQTLLGSEAGFWVSYSDRFNLIKRRKSACINDKAARLLSLQALYDAPFL